VASLDGSYLFVQGTPGSGKTWLGARMAIALMRRGRRVERNRGTRGLDFLFSRNRLNVAISRAQCLAYLVCALALLDVDWKTVEQMRLANALCRFVELAS
jgi:hypothetical protein